MTVRMGNWKDPVLKPWAAAKMKATNDEVVAGIRAKSTAGELLLKAAVGVTMGLAILAVLARQRLVLAVGRLLARALLVIGAMGWGRVPTLQVRRADQA